jgi:hypothetical protein
MNLGFDGVGAEKLSSQQHPEKPEVGVHYFYLEQAQDQPVP